MKCSRHYGFRAFSIPVYGFVPGGENVGRQSLADKALRRADTSARDCRPTYPNPLHRFGKRASQRGGTRGRKKGHAQRLSDPHRETVVKNALEALVEVVGESAYEIAALCKLSRNEPHLRRRQRIADLRLSRNETHPSGKDYRPSALPPADLSRIAAGQSQGMSAGDNPAAPFASVDFRISSKSDAGRVHGIRTQ